MATVFVTATSLADLFISLELLQICRAGTQILSRSGLCDDITRLMPFEAVFGWIYENGW
jgi:hypothetical protein